MARTTPTLKQDGVLYQENEPLLRVDSVEWFSWLEVTSRFAFHGSQGSFTARKERSNNKRGGLYWKAYSRRNGKLHHVYLGKTETLTFAHLSTAAAELATLSSPIQEPEPLPQSSSNLQYVQMLDLIGREQETEQACSLLRQPEVRIFTITGPGGVGKTRFALHVAHLLAADFKDGIRSISLAPITDPALVVAAIAQDFGFVRSGDEPLFSRLATFLRGKHLLLLLDNFEQVAEAASLLLELVSACPSLKVLVTSREILHLRIEYELRLPPLALPELQHLPSSDRLSHYPAIALFLQRAQAAQPNFYLTPDNAPTIAEICTRLDGLPLALELAAARCKLLSPKALLARLDHRLHLLTQGARDLPKRQQTLRDTIAWSYDLLDDQEQWLFRLLSVFVNGCTLEEAEHFCQSFQHPIPLLLEKISSLIDKNLLQRHESPQGDVGVLMLETIREYGLECLAARGEDALVHRAHALYFLSIAEQAAAAIRTDQQDIWLNRLHADYPNLHAALGWLTIHHFYVEALRLCASLWPFWLIRAHQAEGYHWGERLLKESADLPIDIAIQARACYAIAMLADSLGLYQRAYALWEKSLSLSTQLDDHAGIVASLNKQGHILARNAPAQAQTLYQKSLSLARQWNDLYGIADALTSLADEAFEGRDLNRARTLFQESLSLYLQVHDIRSQAYCLSGLGQVAASESKYTKAFSLLTESLRLYRTIGDRISIAFGLVPLGMVTLYLGDYSTARTHFEESQAVSKALGNQNEIAAYLGMLGEIALEYHGEQDPARTLLEESLALFRETGNEEGIASQLFTLGAFELERGNLALARKLFDEAETLFRTLQNQVMRASTLQLLGHLEAHRCNFALAHTFMQESVTITRQMGDYLVLSARLAYLGLTLLNEEKIAEARPLFQESLALARESGDARYIADALGVMGLLFLQEHDYAMAQSYLEESRAICQRREDQASLSYRLADLGMVAIQQEDMARARPLIEESLSISLQMGNRWFVASCLERLGEIEAGSAHFQRATELWGCASALREEMAAPMPTIERAPYERALTRVRQALSPSTFASAWQAGTLKGVEEVLSLPVPKIKLPAPHFSPTSHITALPSSRTTERLTQREHEILLLVAKGLTNAQIAEQLVLSPRTVQTHLRSIYGKIHVSSRSAATRYAFEHHLDEQ